MRGRRALDSKPEYLGSHPGPQCLHLWQEVAGAGHAGLPAVTPWQARGWEDPVPQVGGGAREVRQMNTGHCGAGSGADRRGFGPLDLLLGNGLAHCAWVSISGK